MRLLILTSLLFLAGCYPVPYVAVETPLQAETEGDKYANHIRALLLDLESPDFLVREKSYRLLCQESWNDLEPLLPRQGCIGLMRYMRQLERMTRPDMKAWFEEYRDELENPYYSEYTLSPSFSRRWAEKRPVSIFDPCEIEPVNVWPKNYPDYYRSNGKWKLVNPPPPPFDFDPLKPFLIP